MDRLVEGVIIFILLVLLVMATGCGDKAYKTWVCDNQGYARQVIKAIEDHQPVAGPGEVCKSVE